MSTLPATPFVEQRSYSLAVGQVPAYLQLYEREGLPVQQAILEHLVGYYSVELGELNTVTHLWAFTSHAERDARRARLQADARWQAYWAQARLLIVRQQSVLLKPAPFFQPLLQRMLGAAHDGAPHTPIATPIATS